MKEGLLRDTFRKPRRKRRVLHRMMGNPRGGPNFLVVDLFLTIFFPIVGLPATVKRQPP
jgi:hypothetical protein